jgi:hypothetical protein
VRRSSDRSAQGRNQPRLALFPPECRGKRRQSPRALISHSYITLGRHFGMIRTRHSGKCITRSVIHRDTPARVLPLRNEARLQIRRATSTFECGQCRPSSSRAAATPHDALIKSDPLSLEARARMWLARGGSLRCRVNRGKIDTGGCPSQRLKHSCPAMSTHSKAHSSRRRRLPRAAPCNASLCLLRHHTLFF